MLLPLFAPRFQNQTTPKPTWHIAWGELIEKENYLEKATWQEGSIAFVNVAPVFSPSQRYALAGEIWLCQPEKGSLQNIADRWDSGATPESLLESIEGAFAFVVWDRERRELTLVRDRVGTKTLYYTTSGNISGDISSNISGNTSGKVRRVAPRLRTLAPFHSRTVDAIALRDYLCCSFVPGERTLWQEVRELRPGSLLRWPGNLPQTYWQPRPAVGEEGGSLATYAEEVRSCLDSIMPAYLPPGEPVGAYLSGGLDSSCIVALAKRLHDRPVHTYSIHFGKDYPNELEFANLVAEHCQTVHHVLEIPPQKVWQELPETLAHLDDPIGDPLTVPNYLLGQAAAETVGVILNGEGGDPCFGGPKNKPLLLQQLYGENRGNGDLLAAYLHSFKKCAAHLPDLLRPEVQQAVAEAPSVFSPDLMAEYEFVNRLMLLNIKFKGADHILTKVNNMTSAAGLSGRSPLFDSRIVALSLEIPPRYKLDGAEEKAVLKQAVLDLLPERIIFRPKSGMRVPVGRWFYDFWRGKARRLLLRKDAAIAPYLNQNIIREWLNFQGDPWGRYGIKLWMLTSLEIWLQVHQKQ